MAEKVTQLWDNVFIQRTRPLPAIPPKPLEVAELVCEEVAELVCDVVAVEDADVVADVVALVIIDDV